MITQIVEYEQLRGYYLAVCYALENTNCIADKKVL